MTSINPPRSTFVTIIAWLGIVFSGFTFVIGILQNLMLHLFMPLEDFRAQMSDQVMEQLPRSALLLLEHFEFLFAFVLVISLAMLITSNGLLKRQNWARWAFIGFLLLGIVWNIGGLVMQQSFVAQLQIPADVPSEFDLHFGIMMNVIRAMSVIFALALSLLCCWMAWKLSSPAIAAEFIDVRHPQARG
ncbi:hypothetical protein [Wenzhouxiangella marina]|uniref:Uncharacterized protein n=1 Tax=Wenzhouxiangella marina TaxID=1579979 RepID=A0A0K0Y0J8_9GAMM|nr:hypothetical protein [Wenzhouxiangella marina]AKS43396.1 hypothetical protein WM2015_3044 [Wenzhouxiangella marina]MBB6088488.1 magnesium-transporting ATPase (P-type) [Wenzhouxiangella marina]